MKKIKTHFKKTLTLMLSTIMFFTNTFSDFPTLLLSVSAASSDLITVREKVSLNEGALLLYWGAPDDSSFNPGFIMHVDADGKEYPAYCVQPNNPGVRKKGPYQVSASEFYNNPEVLAAIKAGYPYNNHGLNDYQAYYATQIAIWSLIHEPYGNPDAWSPSNPQTLLYDATYQPVKDAMLAIYHAAKGATAGQTKAKAITASATPSPADDDILDSNYLSQTFTVNSDLGYTVKIASSYPSGTKITDENNNEKSEFAAGEKFKVLVKKLNKDRVGSFKLNITTIPDVNNPDIQIMSGISIDAYQNYAVLTTTSSSSLSVTARYEEVYDDIPDPPQYDPTPGTILINKYGHGTIKGLPGAVFRITDANGGDLGTYATDEKGQVEFTITQSGVYYVEEIVPPEGYVLSENNHQHIVANIDTENVLTFENHKESSMLFEKIDADTGETLFGAVVRLAREGGTETYDITIDGLALKTELQPGTYTITEIVAPDGYLLDTTPQTIILKEGEQHRVVIKNKKKPGILIKKYDEKTGQPLAGAEFSVKQKDGNIVYEGITNYSGTILIEGLDPDWYTINEIAAPDGYIMTPSSKTVELIEGKTVEVKFDNRKKPSLRIAKIDSETGKPLAGAVFKVWESEGSTVSEYTTDELGVIQIDNLNEVVYSVQEIKSPEGYLLNEEHKDILLEWGTTKVLVFENVKKPTLTVTKVDADTNAVLAGATIRIALDGGHEFIDVVTDKNGVATVEDLAVGTYTVKEIIAPSGYILDETPHSIKIESGVDAEITLKNHHKPGLIIRKFDEATAELLPNAEFSVAKKGGQIVYEGITDKNGEIFIENLDPDWYVITELAPPDGYLIATESKTVELEAGKVLEVKFDNRKRPSLEILKIDEATSEPLAGAKFRIWKTEDSAVSEYVTDKTGKILIENLDEAIYSIEEIVAPDGYIIETQHKDVELHWGKTTQVVFTNKKKPILEIQKIDAVTREPLSGAKFKVTKNEDKTVSEFTTGVDGKIVITDLDEAIYTVEEILAPEGYILETQHKEIALEWGMTKTLIYENTRKPTLIITKINALTYKPIPNTYYKVQYDNASGGTETLGTYRTNENGQIVIPKVDAGWYTITETRAAQGYSIASNPTYRLYLSAGENAYLTDGLTTGTETENSTTSKTSKITVTNGNGEEIGTGDELGVLFSEDGALNEIDSAMSISVTSGLDYVNEETAAAFASKLGVVAADLEVGNYPLNSIVIRKTDAITGKLLSGARFKLYQMTEEISGSGGTLIGEYTTDNSGIIVISGLEPGGYFVEEDKAPQNYMLSENSIQQAWLKADGTTIAEITFANYPYGSILISKVDAKTLEPLANAKFKVTNASGAVVGDNSYTTDSNGEILVPNVEPGAYVVTEIQAPDGYVLDSTPQTIQVLQDGKIYRVSFQNQPISTLVIKKYDDATQEPLAGAEFLVTNADGSVVGTSNGIYTTDKTGTIEISGLPKGSYVVKETKAPSGYVLEQQAQTIEIDYAKTYTLSFYNKPMSSLQIVKIDADTKEPLKDAQFKIYKQNGELLGTYTTDGDGIIIIDKLETGWYKAVESKAPTGYVIDDTPQDFEIIANQFVKLTFENKLKSTLVIKKVDQISGEPLSGTTFTVAKQSGEFVGEYLTDEDGLVTLASLDPAWYIVTETVAPTGYHLNETAKTVEVKAATPTVVTFRNKPLCSIEIIKVNNENSQPLPNVLMSSEKPSTIIKRKTVHLRN